MHYIAGYIAHQFRTKYRQLGSKTGNVPLKDKSSNWTTFISNGHLMLPTEDLLETVKIVDYHFNQMHGDSLSKEKLIFKKLVGRVEENEKNIKVPKEVLCCIVRTRTYVRLRFLNKIIKLKNKTKNKKKIQKLTNVVYNYSVVK